MATESRRPRASLIEALRAAPERFEFLQAVRILELAAQRSAGEAGGASAKLGADNDPAQEAAVLRAAPETVFPPTEVAALRSEDGQAELEVNVLGLNGPSAALPGYYSQMILTAGRNRNPALRDFFDLFNHRALSLFARASEKYRLPLAYQGPDAPSAVRTALLALVGVREEALQRRQSVSDETLIFYGGHLSRRVPSAAALEQLLSEYFESPVTVVQFIGRWFGVRPEEQSRLGGAGAPGPYTQLGANAVVGSMVYDVQGAFRIRLGPLTYPQFLGFLPDGPRMAELGALVRTYVGSVLNFDTQLRLAADEVPALQLAAGAAPRLGWNTWLPTTGPREDAVDAVFRSADS